LDVNSGSFVWHQSLPGNYPFSQPIVARDAVAVLLEFNFVRKPTGVWQYSLDDGTPFTERAIAGIKHLAVDTPSGCLFVAVECDRRFQIGSMTGEGVWEFFRLPYDTQGRSLLDLQPVSPDQYVVVFGHGQRRSHELWSRSEERLIWKCKSKDDRCVLRDGRLITYCWREGRGEIGEIDVKRGRRAVLGTLQSPGISNLYLLQDHMVVWINHDRQLGFTDLSSNDTQILVHLDATCPGWADMALLPGSGRLFTLNTNNHTDPRAELKLFEIGL
jgi:hypothetical protein